MTVGHLRVLSNNSAFSWRTSRVASPLEVGPVLIGLSLLRLSLWSQGPPADELLAEGDRVGVAQELDGCGTLL